MFNRSAFILLALLALILPAVGPTYLVHIAVLALINMMPVIGVGLLSGYAGRVTLAQGAVFGIGAYISALLTTAGHVPPMVGMIPAAVGASLIGVLLGGAALRLSGLYFVMATIGVQQIVWLVLTHWSDVTGGSQGVRSIPPIDLGPISLATTESFYYFALAMAALCCLLAYRLIHSRLGLKLRAIGDDDLAAASSGVGVNRSKITVLALSSALAGAGGFLQAHYLRYVHPDIFTLNLSVLFLTMSMFGGHRSLGGMVIATLVLTAATEFLRPFGDLRMIIYGALLLLGMMFFPSGVVESLKHVRKNRGDARYQRRVRNAGR